MNIVRRFFSGIGIVTVLGLIGLGIVMAFGGLGGGGAEDATGIAKVGMISREMMEQVRSAGAKAGQRLAWLTIAFSAMMQGSAWVASACKLRWLRKLNVGAAEKLEQLEAIEIYFDLPLYFGLLGSVLSFILITIYPDAGLMFAYASTAMGIMVSVILRLGYHTPFKQKLIRERGFEAERNEAALGEALVPLMPPQTVRHALKTDGSAGSALTGATTGQILK